MIQNFDKRYSGFFRRPETGFICNNNLTLLERGQERHISINLNEASFFGTFEAIDEML
jgi:hypothetical protein